jgi:hypothetical protein
MFFVFGQCFYLILLLAFVRVPVPQDLPGDDAIQNRRTNEGEQQYVITSLLYRCEDASQRAKEKHKTCDGRQLTCALILVVGERLDQLQQKEGQHRLSETGVQRHNVYMPLTSKLNETTENCDVFSLQSLTPVTSNHTTDFVPGKISGSHGGEYEDVFFGWYSI